MGLRPVLNVVLWNKKDSINSCCRVDNEDGKSGVMEEKQYKRTPATIIKSGKASNIFELNKNMPNQDFWEECKRLRESGDNSVADATDILITKDGKETL